MMGKATTLPATRQRASLTIRRRETVALDLTIDITSTGLLSITALVSSILLSTAVVVRTARRGPPRRADEDRA